ncbi:glycosyltransferase family 39 protein, partial [Singulisphaera rosea]
MRGLTGRAWWGACTLVFAASLAATLPTTGDIGLTWDEPAYRYSQEMSAQWWEGLASARSWDDASPYLEPDALLYYWPYGRHGINFHPPFAGQMNLATHALVGRWWQDTPSRRLATVLEYVLTITIG